MYALTPVISTCKRSFNNTLNLTLIYNSELDFKRTAS